jgi:hypothetical protein
MAITNGYATLNDVKAALRIPVSDTVDDSLLELSIEAASREIDGYCERVFYNVGTATRVYMPEDGFITQVDDVRTITTLKTSSAGDGVYDVTWAETDYQLEPLNGIAGGVETPGTRIRAVGDYIFPVYEPRNINSGEAAVQVVGVFGYATVPTAIKQATILYAMRQFKRYDSPLGVAGFGDLGLIRVGRFDPDIEALLMPYRKVLMA